MANERAVKEQSGQSGSLGLHVIRFPSGNWGFVGDIPKALGLKVPADKEAVMGGRAFQGDDGQPMMLKFPSFKTLGMTVAHARQHGYEPRVTDEDRKVAEQQGTTAYLVRVRVEVATGGRGRQRPGYRWEEGYQLVTPAGEELVPYMRKSEAREECRDCGWTAEVVGSIDEARAKLAQERQARERKESAPAVRVTVRGHVYDVTGYIEAADRSVGIMSSSFNPDDAHAVDPSAPEFPWNSLTDQETEEIDRAFWAAQPPEQCDPLDEEQEPDLGVSR